MQAVYELTPVIAAIISGDWNEAKVMAEGMLAEPWHLVGYGENRLREFLELRAASRPVAVAKIPTTRTGPTTGGPDGSMGRRPPRPSAKKPLRSAKSASRTTSSCTKRSRRPSPTHSTKRLGRKRRKNDGFNSGSYSTQSRTPTTR